MPITPVGYLPLTPDQILIEVQTLFKNVFGQNVDLNPQGVIGQMVQEFTNQLIKVEGDKTLLYGGLYNPDIASGSFLYSLAKFDEILPIPASQSEVDVVVTGLPSTVIPINSKILNKDGKVFYNKVAITIGANSTGTGKFYSEDTGMIDVSANTINNIVQTISGWDTVNNPTAGILGRDQETDSSFRKTRRYALAKNSSGTIPSLNAAFEQEPTIENFLVLENPTNAPININGADIPAHCLFITIYATDYSQVAPILYNKKSAGCETIGNTPIYYSDPKYPWVNVHFYYQTAQVIYIKIVITFIVQNDLPSNIDDQIKDNIINNFYGLNVNLDKVRIGDTIYAGRFYQSVTSLGINQITLLTVGDQNNQGNSYHLTALEVGVLTRDNIIINQVNQ